MYTFKINLLEDISSFIFYFIFIYLFFFFFNF